MNIGILSFSSFFFASRQRFASIVTNLWLNLSLFLWTYLVSPSYLSALFYLPQHDKYGNFESLYYALGLNGECQSDDDTPIHFTEEDHNPKPPTFPVDAHGMAGMDYELRLACSRPLLALPVFYRHYSLLLCLPHWPFSGTGAVLFVDYANGADSNDGSQAKPFKTISQAVATAEGMSPGVTINLRAGTHYVLDTVQFSAKASSVTIQNYNGESAHRIRK